MNETYKINQYIPGWNQKDIQLYLAEQVSILPNDAVILELGALFGRTTYVLGHNKPYSATLITVDPWMTYDFSYFVGRTIHDGNCSEENLKILESKISKNPDRIEGDDFYDLWKYYVGDINNLMPVREFSPVKNREWPMFDFIYHDASHEGPNVYEDLSFWFPKLKQNGKWVMDDYHKEQFPDLCRAVDTYVKENRLVTRMIGSRNIEIVRP